MTKPIKIGLVGDFQSGKSTLINCLLGRSIASTGNGTATTHTTVRYLFGKEEYILYDDNVSIQIKNIKELSTLDTSKGSQEITVYVNCPLLEDFTLIDMPGLGSINRTDDIIAEDAIAKLDYAIVIATNEKSIGGIGSQLYKDICILKRYKVPYYFIMNCTKHTAKKWFPSHDDNVQIMQDNHHTLRFYKPIRYPFDDPKELIVNLHWYLFSIDKTNPNIIKNKRVFSSYGMYDESIDREAIYDASNFQLIEKIFSMDNKMYLELKKEFKQEMAKLRDEVCPVGTIQVFAFNKVPEGWLPCDGRTLDAEDYPELFNAIDFTFGGNGKTEFVIPDLRGRFVRGWDDKACIDKDRLFGSSQDDSFQGHEHKIREMEINDGQHYHHVYTNDGGSYHSKEVFKLRCPGRYHDYSIDRCMPMDEGDHKHTIPSHASTAVLDSDGDGKARIANETRPKNIALLYCIKAINSNNVKPRTIFQSEIELNNLYINDGQFTGFVALFSSFAIKDNGNVIRNRVAKVIVVDNDEITKKRCIIERDFKIGNKGVYFMKFTRVKKCEDITMVLEKVHTFGIIGDFNKWEKSVEMQLDTSRLCYYCTLKLKKGDKFKFRANNKWGSIELDGDPNNLSRIRAKDIECKESGEYEITLDIQTHPWHCILKKIGS